MKTNQAKAVAGIKFKLTTREDYARAERDCLKLIISARKAGDDNRAAELSEAKSFFQKRTRTRNRCAVCGDTIARGATHCRIHSRQQNKLIAAPAGIKPTERRKDNGNARLAIPRDNLAPLGFYAAPVQKVVSKWRDEIGEQWIEHYFMKAAHAAIYRTPDFGSLAILTRRQLAAFYAIGTAILEVCEDKSKPAAWILGGECEINGRAASLSEIRAKIIRQGGKAFSEKSLATAFHRLKLTPTKEQAEDYRRFRHFKNPPKK